MIDAASGSKISRITPNIGTVYAGMGPDYRILVDKARKVSHTNYKRIYNEYPPTRILVQDVARVMQEATQSGGVRPYGVSLLVAGWDDGIEPEKEAENAGDEGYVVVERVKEAQVGHGLNAATGEYVDLVEAGIIDPVKVARSALRNAASIAGLVLTTETLVVEKQDDED